MAVAAGAETARAAEMAAVSAVNGASRAGKQPFQTAAAHSGRPQLQRRACEVGTLIETFEKRRMETRRLESRRGKAADRKQINARKAAGPSNASDHVAAATEKTAASDAAADVSIIDLRRSSIARKGGTRGDPVSRV